MLDIWSDISVQHKTEILLRALDYSLHSIVIVDQQQRIVLLNHVAEQVFGIEAHKIIGQPISLLIPERFREAHREHFERFAKIGVTSRAMGILGQIYGLHTDGTEFPIKASIADLGSGYFMAVIVDRSELEEMATNLQQQIDELDAFTYSVAHDLRAPLRSIAGFVEVLEEDYSDRLDTTGQYFLGLISKNSERMGNLIDDLLAFSRLGNQPLIRQKSDMAALAQETYDYLRRGQNGRKITFTLKPMPASEEVDRSMMRQVWANLISNALKFTQYTPEATIEAGYRNGKYYISDNGVGFDQKYVNKLFVVFSRLHSSSKYDGTGVGLAIVKKIIEKHGGQVRAEGVLNGGATFYFSIGNGNGKST